MFNRTVVHIRNASEMKKKSYYNYLSTLLETLDTKATKHKNKDLNNEG